MISTMSLVQLRFNKIKDHKPKASKKLNELGLLLASAYKLDPGTADKMWQYLIELNVTENPENAKFYIAQVFKKITGLLAPEESADLLTLTHDRLQLMIRYGYEGGGMWQCFGTLIQGFLTLGNIDECLYTVDLVLNKLGNALDPSDSEWSVVVASIDAANTLFRKDQKYKDSIMRFLEKLLETDDRKIQAYIRVAMVVCGYINHYDFDDIIALTLKYKFSSEFIELLWMNRDKLSPEAISNTWIFYLKNMEEDTRIPYPNFQSDKSDYDNSKMSFFVSVMKSNDTILPYYFNSIGELEECIVYSWITEGDWDRFTHYIAKALNHSTNEFENSSVYKLLENYLDSYLDDDDDDEDSDSWDEDDDTDDADNVNYYHTWYRYIDRYGRSLNLINDKNLPDLEAALAAISSMTIDAPLHDEYHEYIKDFMTQASGNLDALNACGFNERIDTRTPEQQLKEYVHRFLQSGKILHEFRGREYSRIRDRLLDINTHGRVKIEISSDDVARMVESSLRSVFRKVFTDSGEFTQEEVDYLVGSSDDDNADSEERTSVELERDYSFAKDPELAEFYFRHNPNEYNRPADLLLACIKKRDFIRAFELVDMMASTKYNEGYNDINGWGWQSMLSISYLMQNFTDDRMDEWWDIQATPEMKQVAMQIVDRILPDLPSRAQKQLTEDLRNYHLI